MAKFPLLHDTVTPANGQVLAYDDATKRYVPIDAQASDAAVADKIANGTATAAALPPAINPIIDARTRTGQRPVGQGELAINVKDAPYNATGDGVTDDTAAINAALAAAAVGQMVLIPAGTYRTTGTVTIGKPLTLDMAGTILADHAATAISVKDSTPVGSFTPSAYGHHVVNARLRVQRKTGQGYESNATAIGVDVWNVFSGILTFESIQNNHTGVRLVAEKYGTGFAGLSYCRVNIGVISSKMTNIRVQTGTAGWVTQNQFYSGSLTGPGGAGSIHVDFQGPQVSANTFYSTSFEGHVQTAVRGRATTQDNRFIDCRYEMPSTTVLIDLEASPYYQFLGGTILGTHILTAGRLNDNSLTPSTRSMTKITFDDFRLGAVTYFDRVFYLTPNKELEAGYDLATLNTLMAGRSVHTTAAVRAYSATLIDGANIVHFPVDKGEVLEFRLSNYAATELRLTTPPRASKFITIIRDHMPVGYTMTLSASAEFAGLSDPKALGLTVPVGGPALLRLFYSKPGNKLVLLEKTLI